MLPLDGAGFDSTPLYTMLQPFRNAELPWSSGISGYLQPAQLLSDAGFPRIHPARSHGVSGDENKIMLGVE
jgi:hypothetical protein